jgi:hypothetical protein
MFYDEICWTKLSNLATFLTAKSSVKKFEIPEKLILSEFYN